MSASTSPAAAARCAAISAMPSPRAACSTAVRVNARSVAASCTTPFWIADSKPQENENPPMGNIESPNCSMRARNAALSGCSDLSSPMVDSPKPVLPAILLNEHRSPEWLMGAHRWASVHASGFGFDGRIALVRMRMHRTLGAAEKPA